MLPSTSSINLNGVVGYLVYMNEDGNDMEIAILSSDEFSNIKETDRISWSFTEKISSIVNNSNEKLNICIFQKHQFDKKTKI